MLMDDQQWSVVQAESLDFLKALASDSVDLVACSPPYEAQRQYNELEFALRGQEWVDWAVARYLECVRVCRGLVMWVVEGNVKQFRWSATPALLMADLHRAGVRLRKPPIYQRHGVFGGGGPDWWRNDYEFCVCSSKGKLPWSDNTATGKPPVCKPGGAPSHRKADGSRVKGNYTPPALANPGNVIDCGAVGGGNMGDYLAHENEAPYPEQLVEQFVRCFCPPDGIVCDPFCGSGTTGAVALHHGRRFVGCDLRESQVALSKIRLSDDHRRIVGRM